jgi:hypothetical protein
LSGMAYSLNDVQIGALEMELFVYLTG